MLQRLISSLKQELTPLVEAQLRVELEPKIRAEVTEQMQHKIRTHFEQELNTNNEVAILRTVSSYVAEMDKLVEEHVANAKSLLEETFDDKGRLALREGLVAEVNLLVASQIETLRGEMKVVIREELEPIVRAEIIESIQSEVRAQTRRETEAENERITRAHREGLILAHVRHREIETIRQHVANQLRPEVEKSLKSCLRKEVIDQLKDELREKVIYEHKEVMTAELRSKLEAELLPDVKESISRKVEYSVREELVDRLTPVVENKLKQELLLPAIVSMDESTNSSVAQILREKMSQLSSELREQILDEMWEKVAQAILGAIGAAIPFTEEGWEIYIEKAQELVDDRIAGRFRPTRRKLRAPDGFYRAIKHLSCTRTRELIAPGDYYVVIRGNPIRLPMTRKTGEEIEQKPQTESVGDTSIEPPWKGLPWACKRATKTK